MLSELIKIYDHNLFLCIIHFLIVVSDTLRNWAALFFELNLLLTSVLIFIKITGIDLCLLSDNFSLVASENTRPKRIKLKSFLVASLCLNPEFSRASKSENFIMRFK